MQCINNMHVARIQPKHIFLMIYLLWDKKVNGRRSFFWPYYDILPKTLRNMPIFCEFVPIFFAFVSHLADLS